MPEKKEAWKIFGIEDNGGDRKFWRELGVAFLNKDGSFNLKLYFSPGLALQLRPPQEKET
jgi:hypothetical protein